MFSRHSWELNPNIAMFTSTQKALWAHQWKNTSIEASATDHHNGSVERHFDLKFSLKFCKFEAKSRGLFFSSSVFFWWPLLVRALAFHYWENKLALHRKTREIIARKVENISRVTTRAVFEKGWTFFKYAILNLIYPSILSDLIF